MIARFFAAAVLCGLPLSLTAQEPSDTPSDTTKAKFEVYGFAMADFGYNFNQSDPSWFDVVRPSKLPAFPDEFAPNGTLFSGVRQSRLGVRSEIPTKLGALKTIFEFELFGVGVDAGQTTFRLRHAYGELGHFGAGQTWSPFMDIDVFPNSIEYWGPNGMVFFRNVQVRWMPLQGASRVTIALERPGATADQGLVSDRIELQNVRARFPLPDLSAEYRQATSWGYVELAGIVRRIDWVDLGGTAFDLSGGAWGWGANLSSNVNVGKQNIARLQVVYGEGVENYMNDAPADVGVETNPGSITAPVKGDALPVLGVVAFLDHTWSERFTSSIGYSLVKIDNSNLQAPDAYKRGQYALANVLYHPLPEVMAGVEFQWAQRDNFLDGFSSHEYRIQTSFKYTFAKTL